MNQQLINLTADVQEEETIDLVKRPVAERVNLNSILDEARTVMEKGGQRGTSFSSPTS